MSQMPRMSTKFEEDSDLANAEKALLRAAKRARERAAKSGGTVAIYQDGKIIEEYPKEEPALPP